MLIPRFSLRWMLVVMTVCGVLAYIASQAVAQRPWGIAIAVALSSVAVTAVAYAATFLVAWSFTRLASGTRKRRASSPFATQSPPPQILPPADPV